VRQIARIGADAGPGAIQGICATVLQIGDHWAVVLVGVLISVAVWPVGPQKGVSDGALVMRLAVRRVERARRMSRCSGRRSRLVGFAREGRHDYRCAGGARASRGFLGTRGDVSSAWAGNPN
jgi:hypothetical protein